MISIFAIGWIMLGVAILLYLIAINASINNHNRISDFTLVISLICSASAVVLCTINLIKQIAKL